MSQAGKSGVRQVTYDHCLKLIKEGAILVSSRAKWLLILLLFVVVHTVFMAAVAAGLDGGAMNFIVPFGTINYTGASSIAKIEALLTFPLLIWFAVVLLRES